MSYLCIMNTIKNTADLRAALTFAMQVNKWTQSDLSKAASVSESAVCRLMQGKGIGYDNGLKLQKAIGITTKIQ